MLQKLAISSPVRAEQSTYQGVSGNGASSDVSGIFLEKSVENAQGTFVIQRVWDYKRLEGEDWKTEK